MIRKQIDVVSYIHVTIPSEADMHPILLLILGLKTLGYLKMEVFPS